MNVSVAGYRVSEERTSDTKNLFAYSLQQAGCPTIMMPDMVKSMKNKRIKNREWHTYHHTKDSPGFSRQA